MNNRLEACVDKAMQHVHCTCAREMVNNAAAVLTIDESCGVDTDPEEIFLEAIRHRMRLFGLACAWPEQAARELARTWRAWS